MELRVFAISMSLLVVTALSALSGTIRAAEPAPPGEFARFEHPSPARVPGQSATLLPDGRWLFVGGERSGAPVADIALSGRAGDEQPPTLQLTATLVHGRSRHTATVLPNGAVLVVGGIGADGRAISAVEILDPETGDITVIDDSGLKARSHHASTLLTEGYVLITGGLSSDGEALADAELWNPDTLRAEPLERAMTVPRVEPGATLLSDGTGLIWGGEDASGRALATGEVYDPTDTRFSEVISSEDERLPPAHLADAQPYIDASVPPDGALDVPVEGRIAVRFSKRLQVESVAQQSVTLVGPAGAVSGRVVAASDGMLAFFTPHTDLLPGTTYTLFLRGLVDAQGQGLAWSALTFTTERIEHAEEAPILPPSEGSIPVNTTDETLPTPSEPQPELATQVQQRLLTQDGKETKNRVDEPAHADENDDEFEDWIPGEHHRHGQWRVLGTKNEPRTSKRLSTPVFLKATGKTTALAGRVARLNGRPIEGVLVSAGGVSATTDAQGRFLLSGLRAGVQELTVDGNGVTSQGRRYATHFIRADVAPNRTTRLEQPIYLARLNPADEIAISSPADRDLVLTHPNIPGLELHIPKGTVLRTRSGRLVRKLSIVPLPVDRVPFPVPEGFPVYFTIQPAGVFVDGSATGTATGVRVIYPNYGHAPPGTRVAFWNYDPTGEGWQVYGHGTVSEDGKQVVPDQDVEQRNFMAFGYGLENVGNAPAEGPPPGGCALAGDPVDCSTGLFIHTVTDVYVVDTLPLALTRTYRQNDTISRDFGIGANHNYGMFLSNPTGNPSAVPPAVDLILPDGGRVRFQRTSGTSLADSIYQHFSTPTAWQGATLRINVAADRWQITTRDKTVYEFSDHAPNTLVAIRDRYGNEVAISRAGTGGKISQVRSPNGRRLVFTYDAASRITQIRDDIGRTVQYEYDGQGRLWKVTDPDSQVEQYEYDSAHRLTRVIDKRGNTMVTNEYDGNGRVSQQTLADGAIWGFDYTLSSAGKVQSTAVTNPRGYVTQMTFNGAGYLTQVVHAVGEPEAQTYLFDREAGTNLRNTITDPLNRVTRLAYDYAGRITHVTRLFGTPDAVTASYAYEPAFGNLESYTDPLSHQTQLDYDAFGNLTGVTDPLGHTIGADYDAHGRVTSITNPLGKTTRIEYDQGDIAAVTDPLERTMWFFTDTLGRLIGLTDPMGNNTRYEYDPLDRITRSIDASDGSTVMTYDANGNVRTVRDPRDGTHEFTYDARNRVKTYTDPLGKTETYNYDGMGNLTSKIDRKNQTTSYTYDALDRLKTVAFADNTTITVVWDAGNRPRQFIDTATGTIVHDYDDLDRLVREVSPQGQVDYEYDAAGRRRELLVAGYQPVSYDYDDAGRLTEIAQGSTVVGFTYDEWNRRETVTLPNGVVGTYGFDEADQLTSIVYELGAARVGEVEYAYDFAGRRIGQSGSLARLLMPATVSSATYNAANRLTAWGGTSLSYDDNGNLTSAGVTTYGWNARDELASTSGGVGSFAYDALGRRTQRTVAGGVTAYLHDGMNPVTVDGELLLAGLGLDEFYARVSSSQVTSVLTDALGSTRLLTAENGSTTAAYSYAPYGTASKVGSDNISFQFTGRENDGATNLYYYRARYYSPELSRFVSEDPIGLLGGINTFAYVHGNPVTFTDPTGEYAWVVAGAVIGAAVNVGMTAWANGGLGNLSANQIAASAASGAISGAIGALAGPLGGTVARGMRLASNGAVASVATGGIASYGGGVGQLVANWIDPCNAADPLNAAFWAGVGGGGAKYLFPTRNLNTMNQASQFGPSTLAGLFGTPNAWFNLTAFWASAGVAGAANFPHFRVPL